MKKLKATSQFKKDYKRIRHIPSKVKVLTEILKKLADETPIPMRHSPHLLSGNYKGYMECHIESDFLLIWLDASIDEIYLVRLGSHSDLFG